MATAEQVEQRVAAGINSTPEAAAWAIDYGNGYRRGRSDAWCGGSEAGSTDSEAWRAGYSRGYRWGITHPGPA